MRDVVCTRDEVCRLMHAIGCEMDDDGNDDFHLLHHAFDNHMPTTIMCWHCHRIVIISIVIVVIGLIIIIVVTWLTSRVIVVVFILYDVWCTMYDEWRAKYDV